MIKKTPKNDFSTIISDRQLGDFSCNICLPEIQISHFSRSIISAVNFWVDDCCDLKYFGFIMEMFLIVSDMALHRCEVRMCHSYRYSVILFNLNNECLNSQ